MIARRLFGVLLAFTAAVSCRAGNPGSSILIAGGTPAGAPSGNARLDFGRPTEPGAGLQEGTVDASTAARKSPWLAGGLSFVLPGAGEFYMESYIKSAAFLGAEAALWVLAYKYDQKGNHQTDYFQNYANAHWNIVNYAQYAQSHYSPGNGPYNWLIPGTQGDPPWMRVNWAELNRMEADIGATGAGMYYSHQLPAYNTQSYYELIGKYPQYNQGWDDAPPSFSYGNQLSAELQYYSVQRGQANTYYTTSSTFVAIAVVNHVVSAVDAALTAGSYNRGLHGSVGSQTIPTERGLVTVPVLCLKFGM
jgi:hypothetical protein